MLTPKYAVRDLPQALSQNTLKEQGKDFTASQRQHTEPDLALGNPFSSCAAPLDSAVGQAEQLRDQQVEQEYNDSLGIYAQEKAAQINPLKSFLGEALATERTLLERTPLARPGWSAGEKTRQHCNQSRASLLVITSLLSIPIVPFGAR